MVSYRHNCNGVLNGATLPYSRSLMNSEDHPIGVMCTAEHEVNDFHLE